MKITLTKEYQDFVADLKRRVVEARISAARAVNRNLTLLYWDIGKAIVRKQKQLGWGESVIDRLSKDLQEAFPGAAGFSPRNLRNMKQFYSAYSTPEIWQQTAAKLKKGGTDETAIWQQAVANSNDGSTVIAAPNEILTDVPWGHHLLIMNKMRLKADRLYYLRATAQFGWSRNVLLNQIKAKAHERARELKSHNFPAVLPAHLAEQADEALKSSYNLEFLGIAAPIRELELERRLIERVRDLILELDTAFVLSATNTASHLERTNTSSISSSTIDSSSPLLQWT